MAKQLNEALSEFVSAEAFRKVVGYYITNNVQVNKAFARNGDQDDDGDVLIAPIGAGVKDRIISVLKSSGQMNSLWEDTFIANPNDNIINSVVISTMNKNNPVALGLQTIEGARKMGITKEQLLEKRKADAVLDPKKFIQAKLNDRNKNQATAMKTYQDQYDKYYNTYGYSEEEAHEKAKKAAQAVSDYLEKQHALEYPMASYNEAKDRIRQNAN